MTLNEATKPTYPTPNHFTSNKISLGVPPRFQEVIGNISNYDSDILQRQTEASHHLQDINIIKAHLTYKNHAKECGTTEIGFFSTNFSNLIKSYFQKKPFHCIHCFLVPNKTIKRERKP